MVPQRLLELPALAMQKLNSASELQRQGISKHLRVLEHAGLLSSERVGRESRFLICPAAIEETRTYLVHVSEQWDETLPRPKSLVEE